MEQSSLILEQQVSSARRRIAIGVGAVFFTQFISYLFINARNIATPRMIAELNGMPWFSWLIALPALGGAIGTLIFGRLSDMYGRRKILLVTMVFLAAGLCLVPLSRSMGAVVAIQTVMSVGWWAIVPLCFTAIGDLFPPEERAKWTGLLNLPSGIAATIGPVLGGLVADSSWGWRGVFWASLPLALLAGVFIALGLPKHSSPRRQSIDGWGILSMAIATTALIIGFSWLGVPERRGEGAFLIGVAGIAWAGFIAIEKKAEAPILDPQVLFNRAFLTVAAGGFLYFFGSVAMNAYAPLFAQNVMGVSATLSGSMLTPYTMLVAFMGIPTGFLLAKTRKYQWVYVFSFGVIGLAMFTMGRFTAHTPIWVYILVTSVAGLGMGVIPTINAVMAQLTVPKHLLGVAVGAIFFFQMVGIAVAPAVLGLVQNSASTLEGGLKLVFLAGAMAMLIALFLMMTLPQISANGE